MKPARGLVTEVKGKPKNFSGKIVSSMGDINYTVLTVVNRGCPEPCCLATTNFSLVATAVQHTVGVAYFTPGRVIRSISPAVAAGVFP